MSDNQAAAAIISVLQSRLDALVLQGEGSDAEIIEEITSLVGAAPDSAWDVAAVIHQRHRQGEISAELFHSLASKIVGGELSAANCGSTVDLLGAPSGAPAAGPVAQCAGPRLEIGRVLRDRYVLEERLGRGGMGTVFKALDRYRSDLPEANQYVAIKILHGESDNRGQLLARLRREFYCAQMLSHPNIVKVYELDRDGDVDFFTMELLDGELLSSVLERFQPHAMSRPHALAIIREIGAGLAHAHARGVIHADLKPQNIMITHGGEVRILDFGAASTTGANPPAAATPAYACCELLAGRAPDPRDDIFAFACVSYELLAGVHPFQRRPSNIARDLGIVPKRPATLNWRQWRALTMGLSWHRGGRSITAPAWLKRMNSVRLAVRRLPDVRDLRPAAARRPIERSWLLPSRATSVLATALIVASVWIFSMILSPGEKVGADVIPVATTRPPVDTPLVANDAESALPAAGPHAAGAAVAAAATAAATTAAADAFAPRHRIRLSDNFAEIRVHRSTHTPGNRSWVWWTESASAKPGVDYVPQARATRAFAAGETSASFFIKLIPHASRAQSQVFYLAVAEGGHGAPTGRVARTAIWLPATRDQS